MDSDTKRVSGLLLDWDHPVQRDDLLRCPRLRFHRLITSTKWEEYSYSSQKPLRGEDITITKPPFTYQVICRRSGPRLLLLSVDKEITEFVVEKDLSTFLVPHLRRVGIAVDKLVNDIAEMPDNYALSLVHARVQIFGSSLRSVSFYGDNLAEAPLFRDQMSSMTFFKCGLKHLSGGAEIVQLGIGGEVSLRLTDSRRIADTEAVLRFLRAKGYLRQDFASLPGAAFIEEDSY